MTLTQKQALELLASEGKTAVRRFEGNRLVWRIDGQSCTPIIKTFIARGWVTTHFPRNEGWANISEAGRAAYDQRTLK